VGSRAIGTWLRANGRSNVLGGFVTSNGDEPGIARGRRYHLRAHRFECDPIREPSQATQGRSGGALNSGCGSSALIVVAISALLVSAFAGCSKPDPLEREIVILQDRAMPPGAMLVEKANLVRDSNSASATWEYATDWDWEKYAEWVSNNLATNYKPITAQETKLHFRRSMPGDVFELQIDGRMSSGVRRVRVQFRAFPD